MKQLTHQEPELRVERAHSRELQQDSSSATQEESPAPITLYSRRETDESYEGVIAREGDLRIVNCKYGIQWIVQRFKGGQWRNKSFHRTRRSLVRYGPLKVFLALPEHHDGFVEAVLRCKVCGRINSKPVGGLPRHLYCLQERKKPVALVEIAA